MNSFSFLLPLFLLLTANPPSSKTIHFFRGNIEQAEVMAQQEDKNYLVIVYANWSSSWKMIEQNCLTQDSIVSIVNEQFIPMKLDIDSTDGALFCVQNNVKRLPSLFVFNPNGKEVYHSNKDLTPQGIIDILNTYQSTEEIEDSRKRKRKNKEIEATE